MLAQYFPLKTGVHQKNSKPFLSSLKRAHLSFQIFDGAGSNCGSVGSNFNKKG